MNDTNTVVEVGRLVKSVEVTHTQKGFAIGKMVIAVNRSRKNGEQWEEKTSFFDVTALGSVVDNLAPYLVKGKQVSVTGHLDQDRWTNNDGQKFSRIVIVADGLQLLGGGRRQENAGQEEPLQEQQYGTIPEQPEDIPF